MKFAIASEHRDFFLKSQRIEFESLISSDQLKLLNQAIDTVLAERLGIQIDQLPMQRSVKLFQAGHDLWRDHKEIKRISLQKQWAQFAADLTEQKALRIGYDQFFPSTSPTSHLNPQNQYQQFLQRSSTLQETSCLQRVLCGLMLCLDQNENAEKTKIPPASVLPAQAGNAVFFQPDLKIDWTQIYNSSNGRYLLIVYTHPTSVYVYQEGDPHAHALKQWGYNFGDKLLEKWHPIVFRG